MDRLFPRLFKRKKVLLFVFVTFFVFSPELKAYAKDGAMIKDYDYSEIQEIIDEVLDTENKINFEDYVVDLVTSRKSFSLEQVGNDIKHGVLNEIKENVGVLTSLISIAVIAAVFTNFSFAFQNSQVAETGFYVAYLLLFSVLTVSFIAAANLASDTLSAILSFMKALIPSYFLSVAFCTGAGTSIVFYETTLFVITFVDMLLIKIIIPMINIYLVVSMANNLSKEDLLSKFTDLIAIVIRWSLKSLLALVLGFNTVQGLILPVADKIKKSTLMKAAGAIPGVGDVFGSVAESVLGAGILLKNAIGIAGVLVIVIVCAVPIIKLAITSLIYRVSSAAVQPISDKRMLNCVSATAEASSLLLQTVCIGAVLFLLTITIVSATTT